MEDLDDYYSDVPPWTVINLIPDIDLCEMTIMCSAKRFVITASSEDLHDNADSSLEADFSHMVSGLDDDPMLQSDLEGWMGDPCIPYFKDLAPISSMPKPLTLQHYFVPDTYFFRLINEHGKLTAIRCPDDSESLMDVSPKSPLSELPAAVRQYPLIDMSAVEIVQDIEWEDFGASIPSKVLFESKHFHFKPIQDNRSFLREVTTLVKLQDSGLSQNCRVSRLHSLVVYPDNRDTVLGILLEIIDTEHNFADFLYGHAMRNNGSQIHSKELLQSWVQQLRNIVTELHGFGIIWGDVKPDNVLIDKENNVWVVDFGGGYNSGWVDKDVMETVEGDLQGLSRIAEYVEMLNKQLTKEAI